MTKNCSLKKGDYPT
ncbi:hypothetical protein YPPY94_3961, partial [Yersinia pestis PY-94]